MMRALMATVVGMTAATAVSAADLHPLAASVKPKLKDPTKPFALLVRMKVKADKVEKFAPFFADAIKATRQETGNAGYDLYRFAEDDKVFVLVEKWKSLEALDSHLKTPVIEKLLKEFPDYLDGDPELRVGLPAE